MDSLKQRLEIATELAQKAGEFTLRYFQAGVEFEKKADATPVTIADRETETFLRAELSKAFPADGIVGEEHGEQAGDSGFVWVIDPIDGTKSFVQGVPLYSVLIGLQDPNGESVLGVVGLPALDEIVYAARGEGCWWNDERAKVSEVSDLAEACAVYTGPECFEMTGTIDVEREVRKAVRVVRGWGDGFGHILVATGRAEIMLDPILAIWDVAPLPPIIEEAGGVFTDWSGRPSIHGKSGISTNAALARSLREKIPGCSTSR